MLNFVISVKNVGPNFSPAKGILCELATLVKNIIPGQNPEVYFKFSQAETYVIKPETGKILPVMAPLVEIYPQGGMINKGMIASDIAELARAINTLVDIFMTISESDLDADIPVRTSITAYPGITLKFVDSVLVDSF